LQTIITSSLSIIDNLFLYILRPFRQTKLHVYLFIHTFLFFSHTTTSLNLNRSTVNNKLLMIMRSTMITIAPGLYINYLPLFFRAPYFFLVSSVDVGLVDLNHFSRDTTPRCSVKNSSLLFFSSVCICRVKWSKRE
jgi:hypothetical protein